MIETVRDGVVLIGTAHVSPTSVQQVEDTIRQQRPDAVLVELDDKRFEALRDPEHWRNMDIVQVLRQKKQHLFLLQLYLANMQARIGAETGSEPGAEMLRAIEVAEDVGADVVLIDRDVAVTLRRGFGSMGFWQRLRMFWKLWVEVFTPAAAERSEGLDVDALLETDAITAMTEEFADFAPQLKVALIDERDAYMASHIQDTHQAGQSLVAVVGAGHVPGIRRHLDDAGAIPGRQALDEMPSKGLTAGRVVAYAVPLAILGVFVYLGVTGQYEALLEVGLYWILINGALSAIGAAIAFGHPLSILVAFLAAPLTSLNPLLAAGWFAGLTEAKMRTPTVADFEAIKKADTFRTFWTNGVVRVLLVAALANVGSVVGTYLAGAKIIQELAGGL